MTSWRSAIVSLSERPEVGRLLLSRQPAFAFSRDGGRLLWANPTAGAYCGAGSFEALSTAWPGRAALREIANLDRTLPEKGALARLRLRDDPRSVPLAGRATRIRGGSERGVLFVGMEDIAETPSLLALSAFFTSEAIGAAVVDEKGRALAATGTDASAASDASDMYIGFSDEGRSLRLYLIERTAEAHRVGVEPADLKPLNEASQAGAMTGQAQASSPVPALPPAPPSTSKAQPEPSPRQLPGGATPREISASRPQPAPAPRNPPRDWADEVRELASRTISAGRVPHELSRAPVRFLWQTDAADRFLFVSPGLAQVVGRNAEVAGERWQDVAARLRLDPNQRIAAALAERDTWSGHTAWWPVEGSNVRVPAELTALPVFASDQSFQGYRGFGVLKPAEALMPAAFDARFPAPRREAPKAEHLPPYEEAVSTAPANVIPIRTDFERNAEHTRLTAQEKSAFEEIAAALRERVEAPEANAPEPIEPHVAADGRSAAPAHPFVASVPQDAAPPTEAPTVARPPEAEPPSAAVEQPKTAVPRAPIAGASDGEVQQRLRELTAILDTATDGVLVLDASGVIENVNASAEALFGRDAGELRGKEFASLLRPESRQSALDYLSGLKENGVASLLNEGREVDAEAGVGSIPLFITMGRISSEEGGRFCVVLRDITHWKRTEAELVAARRAAEATSGQKSEFLARVSHEIRTPLNAIIGFAEVMIEERFGPVENERYREYLRDIRTSGEHVVSLVNDLLDISKIEAGKLDLNFVAVPLNELVRECIQLMQPQANRAHVVVRSSLSREVPGIVADQRTMRQIVLNLVSNAIKFTGPGGQVIASTSLTEDGEALLRIRDTGQGMSEAELARALEPFRQINTSPLADRTGTGLGLPLTKALVEANRASLSIRSARGEGTVVTVAFPATRVLSE